MTRYGKFFKSLAAIYVVTVVCAFISDILIFNLIDYGRKPADYIGCYAYDALLFGFSCSGFWGANILSFFLNIPLVYLYTPFLLAINPALIVIVLPAWFFPIMLLVSFIKSKRKNA